MFMETQCVQKFVSNSALRHELPFADEISAGKNVPSFSTPSLTVHDSPKELAGYYVASGLFSDD